MLYVVGQFHANARIYFDVFLYSAAIAEEYRKVLKQIG